MGAQAITWAFQQKGLGNASSRLLLILANEASDERGDCRPSGEHLADLMEIDDRSVRRHLAALEKAGLIFRCGQARRHDGSLTGQEIVLLFQATARAYAANCGHDPAREPADNIDRRSEMSGGEAQDVASPNATDSVTSLSQDKFDRRSEMSAGENSGPDHGAKTAAEALEPKAENSAPGARVYTHARAAGENIYYSPPKSPPRVEPAGTPGADWSSFETKWPWPYGCAREPSRKAFLALPPAEKLLAIEKAEAFIAHQRKSGRRIGEATRYLRSKAWEGFSGAAKSASSVGVFVVKGTPAWDAWLAHRRRTLGVPSLPTTRNAAGKEGWNFPTLFPPKQVQPETATGPPASAEIPEDAEF